MTWAILVGLTILSLLCFSMLGLYKNVVRYFTLFSVKQIFIASSVSALCFYILQGIFSKNTDAITTVNYFVFLLILLLISRVSVRQLYVYSFNDGRKAVAIYGAGESGCQLTNALQHSRNYKPLLFIDDDENLHGTRIEGLPVHSSSSGIKKLRELMVQTVLIAIPSASNIQRKNILERLSQEQFQVMTIPSAADMIEGRTDVSELKKITIQDLLGRDPVRPNEALMSKNIFDKVVLVTGAGGSIGSEICNEAIFQNPKKLILFEISELALYNINQSLQETVQKNNFEVEVVPLLGSIQNDELVDSILREYEVETVYHAAAYKHVPLVEFNVIEAVRNNIFGTFCLLNNCIKNKMKNFILVSSDKAVRPKNIMGATKRVIELECKAIATQSAETKISIVRFGNVLGSSGSVVHQFKKQIKNGGPVTVTHKDITRYFMVPEEAAQLVIQAGAMGCSGDVFVLEMSKPVKILSLAQKMINLNGFSTNIEINGISNDKFIEIKITGLRPGEKLHEELMVFDDKDTTEHPRILKCVEPVPNISSLLKLKEELDHATKENDVEGVIKLLRLANLGFEPDEEIHDFTHIQKMNNKLSGRHYG